MVVTPVERRQYSRERMAATQRGGEMNYTNAWNEYLQRYKQFTDWQNDVFQRLYGFAGLGQNAALA